MRPRTVKRPSTLRTVVKNRDETTQGQRGHQIQFLSPPTGTAFGTQSGKTTAIAARAQALPVPIPHGAKHAVIVTLLSANTNTGAHVFLNIFNSASGSGGLAGGAIARVSCDMVTALTDVAQQIIVPLIGEDFYYETTVSGTVNYTVNFYLVGWVFE